MQLQMSPHRNLQPLYDTGTSSGTGRNSESERLFHNVVSEIGGSFPAVIGSTLTNLGQAFALLSDTIETMTSQDQCTVLGLIDRQVFTLKQSANEMATNSHPLATLAGIMARQAEARADAEAVVLLRQIRPFDL